MYNDVTIPDAQKEFWSSEVVSRYFSGGNYQDQNSLRASKLVTYSNYVQYKVYYVLLCVQT